MKIDTKNHILTWDTKLLIKDVSRKRKNGSIHHNIFYMGALPKEVLELLKPVDKNIYFYLKNDKIYLTAVEPKIDFEQIKIQKVNRHYSLPSRYFDIRKDNQIINLKLDLNTYQVNKSVEVTVI